MPEDQRDELTRNLSLDHVLSVLRNSREYVLFCQVMENGVFRDKKMRFSFFDKERNILLLTRTDIMEVREERAAKANYFKMPYKWLNRQIRLNRISYPV